jgi:hypothetical protein
MTPLLIERPTGFGAQWHTGVQRRSQTTTAVLPKIGSLPFFVIALSSDAAHRAVRQRA